jgi:hypothetical protein
MVSPFSKECAFALLFSLEIAFSERSVGNEKRLELNTISTEGYGR